MLGLAIPAAAAGLAASITIAAATHGARRAAGTGAALAALALFLYLLHHPAV